MNEINQIEKDVVWNIREGVLLCQEIEKYLKDDGYHCALTGSVLFHNKSSKDLDIIIYNHDIKTTGFKRAIDVLRNVLDIQNMKCLLEDEDKRYPNCKDIWAGYKDGKRIDFFFMK